MPSWNDILIEINNTRIEGPIDLVRRKYLSLLHENTGRNVIAYYSGFLQKPNLNTHIQDDDKNGFMATVYNLTRSKGLDLILHTEGGDISATESIVNYLRKMFGNNIRAIIPQIAMSAGTMIACSCKEIVMGKHSNVGPFDPQFNGIPLHGVLEEFKRAIKETKRDPGSIPMWREIIKKYHPTFLGECEKGIQLTELMVKDWLKKNMFKDISDNNLQNETIEKVYKKLGTPSESRNHKRHFHYEDVKRMGLIVSKLEDDQEFQELVLSVHHSFMHTLANTNSKKVIENHLGNAIVRQ